MRFILNCLVLLVPLAFASASFENNNTFTIVYSNDHVITRSVGSAKISYGYAGFWKKELLFSTTHNKSDQRSEFLTISGEYLPNGKNKDANLTFAIQSLTPTDENEPIQEKRFCVQNSSPSLKKMIKACDRQLTLRELVADEEKQMKQFQDRVKGQKATVKLIYDRGQTKAESLGFNSFSFEIGDENSLFVSGKKGNSASIYLLESMFFKDFDKLSFVIETVADGSKFNCLKDSPLGNLIVDCKGPIQIRELKDDEKLKA